MYFGQHSLELHIRLAQGSGVQNQAISLVKCIVATSRINRNQPYVCLSEILHVPTQQKCEKLENWFISSVLNCHQDSLLHLKQNPSEAKSVFSRTFCENYKNGA